ncbi:GHKL domain-containing protein [Flavobacterium rakeshii]|uniref:histidine kinase n=1 Tax=Flavobacterium rakeshii TaxID=1038845 RepID=A0A6N8HD98_9FLAO|nr:HAMP domain-containing sensor histidine kinase [Flavobacterium rakeshii]MUV03970.1 GHKL domain-containing protein [Flavobacterium rakeshii]
MKNSLIKRQIAKHIGSNIPEGLNAFLMAVQESYINYEDQISMLQRAMRISSEELFAANQKLRNEADSLKEINSNLEFILSSMNMDNDAEASDNTGDNNYDPSDYIKQQSIQIIKINDQREQLLQSLEAQNQALNEYAHMVSHDLKAPLRNISTLIEWFKDDNAEKVGEEGIKSLDLMQFNVEKMDLLIQGILDYSSIDKVKTDDKMVDFNLLLDELLRTVAIPKNIEIKINNTLPKIQGNNFKFKQLFQNLIENAIKYNDKEKGCIEISSKEKKYDIEFCIKDNGKGIAEAYFEKIFNIFTKLDSENPSSGIGLSIVKKIVMYYGGKVWLESVENEGTSFYFTIPKYHGTA